MKKTLSIVLAMLMIFSTMGVMAFAQDEAQKVTYIFKNGDNTVATVTVVDSISAQELIPNIPASPVKEDTETTRYTFKGWKLEGDDSGALYYQTTIPVPADMPEGAASPYVFVAEFSEEDISGRQSFWNFIESIFERLNMIFAYFAEIFGW